MSSCYPLRRGRARRDEDTGRIRSLTRAIATPHRLASEAGMRTMAAGGSAIDGALAAAAVLTVVYPHNCALGGDLFALLREPDGGPMVVNASGPAARAVDVERLRAAGPRMPTFGIDTVTVPGLVAGWGALHERGGARAFAEDLENALALARDGFVVTERLADALAGAQGTAQDPGMRAVFGAARAGMTLRQPALAQTLAGLARDGARALYEGPLAERFADGLAALGSAITAEDLAEFQPTVESPLRAELGDCELLTARPNSSGVLLAQALLALRAARIEEPLGSGAGALARIFAAGNEQRERELADPRGALPADGAWLSDEAVARAVRGGSPAGGPHPSGDTAAVVAIDDEGRAVSLIQSLFSWFGAQLLEPATGILLQNRGVSFSLDADHPNVIAPGRRPAHTLMPVMIERDGALLGVMGTMGGLVQAQIHTQLLVRLLGGASPADAVAAPRFAVEPPATARVEEGCEAAVVPALRAAGMMPVVVPALSEDLGHAQIIWRGEPATDPRADGSALRA